MGVSVKYIGQLLLVFGVYFISGWIGIRYAGMGEGSLTLIWLPSGIGLAACIIFGARIWPAIWLGSFAANTPYLIDAASSYPMLKALTFGALAACINTRVQALMSYNLFQRWLDGKGFNHTKNVVNFTCRVISFPSLVNIALLIILYGAGGYLTVDQNNLVFSVAKLWLSGALADYLGYFVITPLAIAWLFHSPSRISFWTFWQYNLILIFGFFALLGGSIFVNESLDYLLVGLGIYAALKLNMRIVALFVVSVSLSFIFATTQGVGPFADTTEWSAMTSMLMFIFGFGLPLYLLAAYRIEVRQARILLEEKVSARTDELHRANQLLRDMTLTDGLTGIANRRKLDHYLEMEWRRALRTEDPVGLLMIDIDSFKRYNDHYGHVKGDQCLIQIAKALQGLALRSSDMVARYGGEEFAFVIPDADNIDVVAERCRAAVESLNIEHADSDTADHVTISVGCAAMLALKETSPSQLVELSDQALYRAKRNGGNQVQF